MTQCHSSRKIVITIKIGSSKKELVDSCGYGYAGFLLGKSIKKLLKIPINPSK
ncbi:hypothetical protein HMPREF3217_01825 [Finegoldia magna]|nr:hypothetical protein HMPREF3217_01825 [Finegoldia magna]